MTIRGLPKHFQNGILLCKLIQFHQPSIKMTGLNLKPIAKNACISNIEKGLSVMWQKNSKKRVGEYMNTRIHEYMNTSIYYLCRISQRQRRSMEGRIVGRSGYSFERYFTYLECTT